MQATFTAQQTAEISRMPYPTLTFLRARGLVRPSVRIGGNRGAANLYGFQDLVALRALAELRAAPSTFDSLQPVIDFLAGAQAHALVEATEKAATVESQQPSACMLVVTASGHPSLENDMTLLRLTEKYGPVLHVVDLRRLVKAVLVEASELRLLRVHVEPGPSGRVPRAKNRKKPPEVNHKKREKESRVVSREEPARPAGNKKKARPT
jgi:hypothetical protein